MFVLLPQNLLWGRILYQWPILLLRSRHLDSWGLPCSCFWFLGVFAATSRLGGQVWFAPLFLRVQLLDLFEKISEDGTIKRLGVLPEHAATLILDFIEFAFEFLHAFLHLLLPRANLFLQNIEYLTFIFDKTLCNFADFLSLFNFIIHFFKEHFININLLPLFNQLILYLAYFISYLVVLSIYPYWFIFLVKRILQLRVLLFQFKKFLFQNGVLIFLFLIEIMKEAQDVHDVFILLLYLYIVLNNTMQIHCSHIIWLSNICLRDEVIAMTFFYWFELCLWRIPWFNIQIRLFSIYNIFFVRIRVEIRIDLIWSWDVDVVGCLTLNWNQVELQISNWCLAIVYRNLVQWLVISAVGIIELAVQGFHHSIFQSDAVEMLHILLIVGIRVCVLIAGHFLSKWSK